MYIAKYLRNMIKTTIKFKIKKDVNSIIVENKRVTITNKFYEFINSANIYK